MTFRNIARRGIQILAVVIGGLLLVEIAVRVVTMIRLGSDYIAFGTRFNTSRLSGEQHLSSIESYDQYSKYRPHIRKKDIDSHNRVFEFAINNIGFRGPDVALVKPEGVFRILCLGGSSTFGYGNRDHETYPYFLDSLMKGYFNSRNCHEPHSLEVINLGMPFQTSERIYHLFTQEGLPLKPDIVLFYEGYNDASLAFPGKTMIQARPSGKFDLILDELSQRIIFAKYYKDWRLNRAVKLSMQEYKDFKDGRAAFFMMNVSKIKNQCDTLGIPLVVITQQAQSCKLSEKELERTTYADEATHVRSRLKHSAISYREACFLAHTELMDSLRVWAEDNAVELVDGIEALDTARGDIKNFVHLNPDANLILARTLRHELTELLECN